MLTSGTTPDPELDELLVSDQIMSDPYPVYRRLRDEYPVFWSQTWNAWVVSRFADVAESLRADELSNENRQAQLFADFAPDELAQIAPLRHYFNQKDVIGSDGPDHIRIRRLVARAFTPRTVAQLRPRLKELARELLGEQLAGGVPFDLIAEVAHPMPVIIIAEMLGAPPEDRALFKRWSAEILAFQGTGRTTLQAALRSQASLLEMFDYMTVLVEDRRARPREDVITALALAEDDGERLTRDELLSSCNTLLTAGHETTTNLIGNLFRLLLLDPAQWRQVREEPGLIDGAIEESLRFDSPKQRNFRRVARPHEFQGARFGTDEMVFQLIGSANRDERQFTDPDVFDVRRDAKAQLAFGAGLHFCLGAPLARLEARTAIEEVLASGRELRLADRPAPWQERVQFRGPAELWVEPE